MKVPLVSCAFIFALALAGCGGGGGGSVSSSLPATPGAGSGGTLQDEFLQAAPSFNDVSMQILSSDATPPSVSQSAAVSAESVAVRADSPTGACHPFLFTTTHNLVMTQNMHTNMLLSHVQALIAGVPTSATTTSHQWTDTVNGVDRKLTITKTAPGNFTFEMDMAMHGSAFNKVYSGTMAISSSGGVTTRNANMTFDYSALAVVYPKTAALGQVGMIVTATHDSSKPGQGLKRTLAISFTNFTPFGTSVHKPYNGSYTHVGEPGIGGYLQYGSDLVLVCPSNPGNLTSNVQAVARWYNAPDGSIHGRADANGTQAQIPVGQTWVGVDCWSNVLNNTLWMMKLEDSSGNTLFKQESDAGSTCDTVAFGAVPIAANNSSDYNINGPVSFPGAW